MKKSFIVILLIALVFPLTVSAVDTRGGYLSVSVGESIPLKAYSINNGATTERDYREVLAAGGDFNVAFGYKFVDWFGVGLNVGLDYTKTKYAVSKDIFEIPFMLEFVIDPALTDVIRMPFKLAAGGHVHIFDGSYLFGAAAQASLGLAIDASEHFTFGFSTKCNLIVQFANQRTDFALSIIPVVAEMTFRF